MKECKDCGEDCTNIDHSGLNDGTFQCNQCEYEENGENGPTDDELIYMFGELCSRNY